MQAAPRAGGPLSARGCRPPSLSWRPTISASPWARALRLTGEARVGGDVSWRAVVGWAGLRPADEVHQPRAGQLQAVEEPADVFAVARVELGRGSLVVALP